MGLVFHCKEVLRKHKFSFRYGSKYRLIFVECGAFQVLSSRRSFVDVKSFSSRLFSYQEHSNLSYESVSEFDVNRRLEFMSSA